MNRRIFALALGLGVAAFVAPRVALAEDHLAEAISHTKEAIDHGKQGHADVLVTHAEIRPHTCPGRPKGHLQSARRARYHAFEGVDCGRKESERPRRDNTCFGSAHSPGSGKGEGEEVERGSIRNGKNAPPLHPRSGRFLGDGAKRRQPVLNGDDCTAKSSPMIALAGDPRKGTTCHAGTRLIQPSSRAELHVVAERLRFKVLENRPKGASPSQKLLQGHFGFSLLIFAQSRLKNRYSRDHPSNK